MTIATTMQGVWLTRDAAVLAVTSANKSASLLKLGADRTILRDANLEETPGRDSIDVAY